MLTRCRRVVPALLAGLGLVLGAGSAAATVVNKVLATVDGEPITLHDLKQFVARNIRGKQLSGQLDETQVLEALITEKLVQREASAKGVVVRDEDVDRYMETIKERNKIDDQQLAQALANQGLTMDAYRAQIREDIQRQQLIGREIRGKVSVTPEEVQRYYEAHRDEYSTPERVQVAHIFFRVDPPTSGDAAAAAMAKATMVHEQLEKGADFADLARQYSEDGSGKDGGSLGWFKQGELLEDIDKPARGLEVGQYSKPVRTGAGVHIIKVEAREDGSRKQLDELADQIKEDLYQQALEDRFQKYLTEELRKRHHVEIAP